MAFTVHDYYCGLGGWSCGVAVYLQSIGAKDVTFHGYECDIELLDQWAVNVRTFGFAAVKHHTTIGIDTIFPEETENMLIHFSPPCTTHSRARRAPPTEAEALDGAASLRLVLDAIVEKRYRRFSIENVSVSSVERIVGEYTAPHRHIMAVSLCASHYGCASDRMRLYVAPRAVVEAVKAHPTSSTTVVEALAAHGLVPPVGATHIRNANSDTKAHRPVTGTSFTLLASHPLVWTNGTDTVRCMTPRESAAIIGFHKKWALTNVKAQQSVNMRGVGNAVAPCVASVFAKYLHEYDETTGGDSPALADAPVGSLDALVEALVDARSANLKRKLDEMESRLAKLEGRRENV